MEEIFSYNAFIKEKIYRKMVKYCAYQDRCHSDVMKKMSELKTDDEIAEEVIVKLIEEGYLNEERFVRSFIRGKFRINKWGKIKIRAELKLNNVNEKLISDCMSEIDENEYKATLKQLLETKLKSLKPLEKYKIRNKLKSYVWGRGYDPELTEIILQELEI
ncbi:MAG: regulatory protein RecX [Deltaproteobacteria bacterium]